MLQELERVLITKLNVPNDKVMDTLRFLNKYHVEPLPEELSEIKVGDKDDRWVLESALRAKADILVTGDKDLLVLSKNVPHIKFISPRGFFGGLKE